MSRKFYLDQLSSVPDGQVRAYLLTNGWEEDGQLGKVATIWRRPQREQHEAELVFPLRHTKDRLDRLVDLTERLAEFEERDALDVVRRFQFVEIDLIAIQVEHTDIHAGTIPLEDGVLLNLRAKDMMTAVAQAARTKRRHFLGGKSPETTEYLSKLRLGQTRVGSYVVNVLAPIEPLQEQHTLTEETITYSQHVTGTLANALSAITTALEEYQETGELAVFDTAVEKGVSANLCEALMGFSGARRNRSFSLSISPSRTSLIQNDDVFKYEFTAWDMPALSQAAGYYRDNYVLPNKTIQGPVRRLDRSPGVDTGFITITTMLPTGEKNVQVELSGKDYVEAIHAHEQELTVECHGDVHVAPRSARLMNPEGFKVFSNRDLFDDGTSL